MPSPSFLVSPSACCRVSLPIIGAVGPQNTGPPPPSWYHRTPGQNKTGASQALTLEHLGKLRLSEKQQLLADGRLSVYPRLAGWLAGFLLSAPCPQSHGRRTRSAATSAAPLRSYVLALSILLLLSLDKYKRTKRKLFEGSEVFRQRWRSERSSRSGGPAAPRRAHAQAAGSPPPPPGPDTPPGACAPERKGKARGILRNHVPSQQSAQEDRHGHGRYSIFTKQPTGDTTHCALVYQVSPFWLSDFFSFF